VSNSHLEYVRDGNTSKEKFDNFLSIFERKGVSNRLYLKRKLMSLKHEESSSLQEHFMMFDDLVRNIKSAGSKIEDDDIICHLLLSLSESYSVVITAIETLSTDNLTLDFVKGRLLDEEVKRCGMSGATVAESKSSNVFYTYNKKEIRCYGCGELGHKRNRCKLGKFKPFRKSAHMANNPSDKDEDEDENAIVFIAEQIVNSATNKHECMEAEDNRLVWLLDSACTDHLIDDDQYFADSNDLTTPIDIGVAKSGHTISGTKIGNLSLISFVNINPFKKCYLKGVLYVKNLRRNLLSTGKLEMAGMKIIFGNGEAKIYRGTSLIAVGYRKGAIYEITFELQKKHGDVEAFFTTSFVDLWNKRLGHVNLQYMKKMNG